MFEEVHQRLQAGVSREESLLKISSCCVFSHDGLTFDRLMSSQMVADRQQTLARTSLPTGRTTAATWSFYTKNLSPPYKTGLLNFI